MFTACVAEGYRLFADAGVVGEFIGILRAVVEKNHCTVPIYCFMPDHLHVMLDGQSAVSDAWQAMVEFKQRTGWWLKQHRPAIQWQKDFYDHVLRDNEDLGAQVRYIAGNPVGKGLVQDWRQYPHTGAIGYDWEGVIRGMITL